VCSKETGFKQGIMRFLWVAVIFIDGMSEWRDLFLGESTY
jgi:hypothetical protein